MFLGVRVAVFGKNLGCGGLRPFSGKTKFKKVGASDWSRTSDLGLMSPTL
jgi:hypothetical protein